MGIGPIRESDPESDDDAGGIFAEINITPVADLFLVLLIIVLVGAPAAAAEMIEEAREGPEDDSAGLDVDLPEGEAREIEAERTDLVVYIPEDGSLFVNGSEVTAEELDDLLRAAYEDDARAQVVLRADEGVFHGRVVGIMERARSIGLSRIAIATAGDSGE